MKIKTSETPKYVMYSAEIDGIMYRMRVDVISGLVWYKHNDSVWYSIPLLQHVEIANTVKVDCNGMRIM